jgi:hypothetical protein
MRLIIQPLLLGLLIASPGAADFFELTRLESFHGTTREELFLSLCEIGNELKLPWTKLKGVTKKQLQL